MPKFYPIINSSNPNIARRAESMMQAIKQSSLEIEALELSFACPSLLDELEAIYKLAQDYKIKIGLASLIDLKQIKALKKLAQPWLDTKLEVFAPAFDLNIFKAINKDQWLSQYLDYIPGLYNSDDLNALLMAGYKGSKFKIYPLAPVDADDFYRSLQGPYPALRSLRGVYDEVIQCTGKVDALDCFADAHNDVIVSSPRDYHKARKKQANYIFEPELRSAQSIIDYIRTLVPQAQIIISGLGGNSEQVKELTGYDFIATRMNADELNKHCSLST